MQESRLINIEWAMFKLDACYVAAGVRSLDTALRGTVVCKKCILRWDSQRAQDNRQRP
jgi:hypothetical protein